MAATASRAATDAAPAGPATPSGPAADAVERILAAISDKRGGRPLAPATIGAIVDDYVTGRVADYQMAAWLATVACRGLDHTETVALTRAYVDSGTRLDLTALGRPVVDKHSTGGVGDKVSMFVVPAVAACGVAVGKLSGRGLAFMGGTIDKLESIKGLRLDLDARAAIRILEGTNMVITGQSDDLVPGDRATYALRDVTATVESLPLIAASVMSKKIAGGATGVVLDVKFGAGALTADAAEAERLATTMIEIGQEFRLACRAVLSDMTQPLGYAIGNALELREAIDALRGASIPGYTELCTTIAGLMLRLGRPHLTTEAAVLEIQRAVASGAAFAQFVRWVEAQGGDPRQVEQPDLLPRAAHRRLMEARVSGWITKVDPQALGAAAARLGAGRFSHDAPIDHAAGLVLKRRRGDRVDVGDPLAELHWTCGEADPAACAVRDAFVIESRQPSPAAVVHAIIGGD